MRGNNEELIDKYLEHSKPVQWVCWEQELLDGATKSELEAILYDENEVLKCLEDVAVRKEFISFAVNNKDIRSIVRVELQECLSAKD